MTDYLLRLPSSVLGFHGTIEREPLVPVDNPEALADHVDGGVADLPSSEVSSRGGARRGGGGRDLTAL